MPHVFFAASRFNVNIQDTKAELNYEEGKGISAEVTVQNAQYTHTLSEQDLIDGCAMYLSEYHNFDPHRLTVELAFEEEKKGISAVIESR